MAFVLSPDRAREMTEILSRYPTRRAASIPLLHLCQEQEGYVSEEAMAFVAEKVDMSPAQVKGVVTFYTLFRTEPAGKHQVWVCKTLSCALRGSSQILEHCEKRLGVHVGETTRDGKVTLRTAECLASCGTAPMMQIDKKYYENLTPAEVDRILDRILLES
jgi:NADH-quinone oxidoreductase subunit E